MAGFTPPSLGDMRVKYQLLAASNTQDASGNFGANATVFIATIWGTLVDKATPYMLMFMSQALPKQIYTITIRYRPGVLKNMQLQEISTGRTFLIEDINDVNHRHAWLVLQCSEFK